MRDHPKRHAAGPTTSEASVTRPVTTTSAPPASAAQAIGSADNKFLLFKAVLDTVTTDAVKELGPRWINRLAGVDVWLESHVRTALIYVRWDD